MRLIINQATVIVETPHTFTELTVHGNAPEPAENGVLRASHANLMWLLDNYPDAQWVDPGNRLLEIRAARIIAQQNRPKPGEYEKSWPFKMQPLPFQLDIFAAARLMPVFALAPVAMGTGKTKMTLDIAADKFMRNEIDTLIVIAPNGVQKQWVKTAIPAHLTAAIRHAAAVWMPNRKEQLPRIVTNPDFDGVRRLRIATFNVEAFSAESGKAMVAVRQFLATGRAMLVMDESSRIKSPKATRTKIIDRLAPLATVRATLSGTPITRGLEDLFTQYAFLDRSIIGISSYYAFRGRYCVLIPIPGAPAGAVKIAGYRNVEEFVQKIAPVTFVVPKSVLGLPEKTYERREVEMTPDQKRLYKALADELVADLRARRIATPANAAVRMLRMQQVLSGHVVEVEEVVNENGDEVRILSSVPIASRRLEVLYDVLAEHDGPAVIWARFTNDIEDIAGFLREQGHTVATYFGETSTVDREEAVRAFKNGEIDYFVANPDAAGTGLDGLQIAQLAVYYSNSFRAESRWQSEDRIHRLGMAGSAHFIDLVVPNSTDTLVLKNLQDKGNVARAVFENPSLLEQVDD
jgi:superfamily II DNA or RNA helicase